TQLFAQLPDLQRAHPNCQFDLICLWYSIEHLRGPWTDLSALRSFLKPGGRLLITTPNAESLRARVLGRRWESYVNPTHFYYFTRTSLGRSNRHGRCHTRKTGVRLYSSLGLS